jgi:hypothetical protein
VRHCSVLYLCHDLHGGYDVHCVPPPGPPQCVSSNDPLIKRASLEGDNVNARQGAWETFVVHSGERLRDETGGPGVLRLSAKGIPERRTADAGTLCVNAQAGRRRIRGLEDLHVSV